MSKLKKIQKAVRREADRAEAAAERAEAAARRLTEANGADAADEPSAPRFYTAPRATE